ncbi:hypothetical protein [Streptomyces sp. NPDC002324]
MGVAVPGGGAAQESLFAVDQFGKFGVGALCPVVGEVVVVDVGEVVGDGVGQKDLREVETDAEARASIATSSSALAVGLACS